MHLSARMRKHLPAKARHLSLSCHGLHHVAVQVADARRQKPSMLERVIKAFNEELAVQITGEVRSKASIWDEGGLAPLPTLQSMAV